MDNDAATVKLGPHLMVPCLKCRSENVIKGRVVNYDNEHSAVFRPLGLRFLALTLDQGPRLNRDGFACLDCGLVWSSTAPDELAVFIRKHCAKGD